jgi:hypothetical protein
MKAVSQDEPRGAEVVKTAVGTLGVAMTKDDFGKQGYAGYFADVSAATPPGASAPPATSLTASCWC